MPRLRCVLGFHPLVEKLDEGNPRFGSRTVYPCPTTDCGTRQCPICGHHHYFEKWYDTDTGYSGEDYWVLEDGEEIRSIRKARKWIVLALVIVLISIASLIWG